MNFLSQPPALSCSKITETKAGTRSAPRFDAEICSGSSYFWATVRSCYAEISWSAGKWFLMETQGIHKINSCSKTQLNFCIVATGPGQLALMVPRFFSKISQSKIQDVWSFREQEIVRSEENRSLKCSRSQTCLSEKIQPLCYFSNQCYRCHFGLKPFWICCPFIVLIVLMAVPYLSGG